MKTGAFHKTSAAALRSEDLLPAYHVDESAATLSLPPSRPVNTEEVSPKAAEAIALMRGQVRSTFMWLQLLMLLVMGSRILQSPDLLQFEGSMWLPFLGLLIVFGALLFLPIRLIASEWFPGLLAVLDTVITTTLFYYSEKAGPEAYTAYFLIILIALFTRTKRHVFLYSLIVTSLYGLALYRDGRALVSFDSHLLQLPVILGVAIACGRAMESLRVLANSDPVTGLPSRQQFVQLVTQSLKQARKSHQNLGVLVLEITGVEQTIKSNGQFISDSVMKIIVNRLIPLLNPGEVLARHGQASLAILKRDHQTPGDVAKFAHDCVDMLRVPLIESGETVRLTAHIGAELISDPRKATVATIIENAKTALIRAKTRGNNCYEFHSADMDSRIYDPLFLEMSLRKALDRRELSVSYQPKVNLLTGQLTGTEALMRWHHPDLGSLSPTVFIPLAEGCGLIDQLGEWILRAACLQGIGWQGRGLLPILISVNVSPSQLRHPQLVPMVSRILKETNLSPQCLDLEITESVLIGEADTALATLYNLKSLGVHLSVDDFGTGYSGLSYLTQLPVDALKIDQRFVREIGNGYQAKAIIKAVVNMALNMGLKITAEGVENDHQALFLRDLGCHEAQGFLYSKPLSSTDMEHYLQAEKQRQTVDATKTALIEALTSRYDKRTV